MATQTKVTPAELVERFCGERAVGYVADPGTRGNVSRGFCGYLGGGGDTLLTGFDGGMEFIDRLGHGGWRPLHDVGAWPYVCHVIYRDDAAAEFAHAVYCEGDLTITTFESLEALSAHMEQVQAREEAS
jgi:hypothetical protein